jgi:hypothetical protein
MCDYSLMSLPNRLAAEGEELVVHRFSTGSIGFTSAADLNRKAEDRKCMSFWRRFKEALLSTERAPIPALCVPPAARLMLRDVDAGLRRKYGLSAEEEVKFVQLSADPNTYRDAICCRSGMVIRLQELPVGQKATVLDLAGDAREDLPMAAITELVG